MAYQVYLLEPIDTNNWIELDCEAVDLTTIFSVADISDISKRKDNITKQISFKGTKINNEAFGSLFHLNRVSEYTLSNRLFFNYSPLRIVDCLIYEDSGLVMRGSLRVIEIDVDRDRNITYQTVVTGSVLDFRDILSEKQLEELDFKYLMHHYEWDTIKGSWEQRTERYDTTISGYTLSPFEYGSGYVYPFIDYGERFKSTSSLYAGAVDVFNFRPAVYVKEYFNAIFRQRELKGYSFEVKGSQATIDKFNKLVVPTNTEQLSGGRSNIWYVEGNETGTMSWQNYEQTMNSDSTQIIKSIQIQSLNNPNNLLSWYGSINGQSGTCFMSNRSFTTKGYAKCKVNYMQNPFNDYVDFCFQICVRDFKNTSASDFSDQATWNVLAQKVKRVPAHGSLTNEVLEFDIPDHTYDLQSQVMFRILYKNPNLDFVFYAQFQGLNVSYSISEAHFRLPKDVGGLIQYNINVGDTVVPIAAQGVKQMDFIKSVMELFNFYVYTNKDRPKHLIFERYDDYYVFTQPNLLGSTAIDWTKKVDYTGGVKLKENVDIPKKYLITFKEDSDYLNDNYKTNYSEVYGTYRFTDQYGLTDEKTLESIFSPSPLTTDIGSRRLYPAIYKVENNQKKLTKSNIRIMYYNGIKDCTPYAVAYDIIDNSNQQSIALVAANETTYPQVGNYLLGPGLNNMDPLEDLYWGVPKEIFFSFTAAHVNCPTGYINNYRGQTTDLTNPDVNYWDGSIYLNEVDIANIDLRTPVFIDMGEMGHAYFKVLSVEYHDNKSTSRVALQKIAI